MPTIEIVFSDVLVRFLYIYWSCSYYLQYFVVGGVQHLIAFSFPPYVAYSKRNQRKRQGGRGRGTERERGRDEWEEEDKVKEKEVCKRCS